jgi:hypothetical protein
MYTKYNMTSYTSSNTETESSNLDSTSNLHHKLADLMEEQCTIISQLNDKNTARQDLQQIKKSSNNTTCRYGRNCKRQECYFNHPNGREIDLPKNCMHGWKCKRKNCNYYHPKGRMMDTNCREKNCTEKNCGFFHTRNTIKVASSGNKKKNKPENCNHIWTDIGGGDCSVCKKCKKLIDLYN